MHDEVGMQRFDISNEEHVDWLIETMLRASARPLVVATIYLVTLSALGAPLLKAAVAAVIAFVLVIMPLGGRLLQGLAVVLLVCTVSIWLDVPQRATMAALADLLLHR